MKKCKFAKKKRKLMALLFFVCLSAVISIMNFPVWGNEKTYTTESVLRSNDYITSVLYDRQVADKYGFYNTNMYMAAERFITDNEDCYKELTDFVDGLTQGASNDEEKLRNIYTWVVENIYYDRDKFEGRESGAQTIYDVFKIRRGVCADYARLLRFMLLSQNIPAVHISGRIIYKPNKWKTEKMFGHEWVMAYVNNRWVNLEPTWDSGNVYEYGKFRKGTPDWEYYKCSNKVMSENHLIRKVNGFTLDNINKTGLFYENGKYYYYIDGEIYTKIVRNVCPGDNSHVFIQAYEPDGSIAYFDTDDTIIEFKDENLLLALLDADADRDGDGKISIYEARTYFSAYRAAKDKLDLSGKKIRDFTGLSYFIDNIYQGKTLDLSNNEISDISPLNVIGMLPEINLSHNQISDLSTLPSAKKLWIDLSYNQISNLSTIPDGMEIVSLSLAHNQISDLSGVEKLKDIEDLDLSYNQISDPSPIVQVASTLNLEHNQIKDRELTDKLWKRIKGIVSYEGNPFLAEYLELNKDNASLKVNKSIQLKAYLGEDTAVQKVEWKSSNPKVATVSSDGRVTAKKKGSAVITCCTIDGSGLKARCKIKVK